MCAHMELPFCVNTYTHTIVELYYLYVDVHVCITLTKIKNIPHTHKITAAVNVKVLLCHCLYKCFSGKNITTTIIKDFIRFYFKIKETKLND